MPHSVALASNAGLKERIRNFFYQEEVPWGMAMARILVPLVLLVPMIPRWFFARELYSSDGAPAPLSNGFLQPDLVPVFSGDVVVVLHSVLIFLLIASSIGFCTRLALAGSFVLYTYLNLLDCISTMTKYSVIASHLLLLLSLSHCGAVWSIDSILRRRRQRHNAWPGEPVIDRPRFPAWPRRLAQLLFGFVYFGAAITKFHTPAYFSGDRLLTWMVTQLNFNHPVGEYLTEYPVMLVVGAYITVVWEILFLSLVWSGWGRRVMLAMGVGFHVMTFLMLGLVVFPMVCISGYFVFMNERDVQAISWHARRLRRKLNWRRVLPVAAAVPSRPRWSVLPAPVAFALLLMGTAFAGIELEHRYDHYGVRQAEGPYQLNVLDREYVETALLAPTQPTRTRDYFFCADLGTLVAGGVLCDQRQEFTQGETLIVQCSLNPPHPDLYVECQLQEADGHIVHRTGQVVGRETMRTSFVYNDTTTITPGDYQVVIRCKGRDTLRRSFTLKPAAQSAEQDFRPLAN